MRAAACGSRSRHCSNSARRAKSPNHSSRPATSSMDNASSTSMMGCPNGRGTNTLRKRSAVELPASVCGSPSLDPRPQHDFERPSRAMLTMELQISFGDVVRVGHVVVDTGSCQSVGAGAVFVCPADRGVNRHIGYVDTLRHQFPCHALCESIFGMTRHCKGPA